MKCVFYNNLKVCFCGKCHEQKYQNIQVKNNEDLVVVITQWLSGAYEKDICLKADDQEKLFQLFADQFTWIDAAGGLVEREHQKYLFIKRFGIWDLPKGKVEPNETVEQAALREVNEETGVDQLIIKSTLPDTFHVYPTKSKMVLKCTHWFHMTTQSDVEPVPQINEQITEVHWLNKSAAQAAMTTTYRSLNEVLGEFFK